MVQKKVQEDEFKQCSGRYMETWEPTQRNVESTNEKVWQMSQAMFQRQILAAGFGKASCVWPQDIHGQSLNVRTEAKEQ